MDMYIENLKGHDIAIYEWIPAGEYRDIAVYFHGTQSYSLWFNDIANRMVERGMAVVSIDRVGCGFSSGEREHIESIDNTIEIYSEFINRLAVRNKPISFIGQSFGGAISLGVLFSGLLHINITNIVLVTSYLGKLHGRNADVTSLEGDTIRRPLNFKTEDFTISDKYSKFINNDPLKWKSITGNSIYESFRLEELYLNGTETGCQFGRALYAYPVSDPLVDVEYAKKIFQTIFKSKSHTMAFPMDRHFIWFSEFVDEVTTSIIEWMRIEDEN